MSITQSMPALPGSYSIEETLKLCKVVGHLTSAKLIFFKIEKKKKKETGEKDNEIWQKGVFLRNMC